jgi:hypothetical protein
MPQATLTACLAGPCRRTCVRYASVALPATRSSGTSAVRRRATSVILMPGRYCIVMTRGEQYCQYTTGVFTQGRSRKLRLQQARACQWLGRRQLSVHCQAQGTGPQNQGRALTLGSAQEHSGTAGPPT